MSFSLREKVGFANCVGARVDGVAIINREVLIIQAISICLVVGLKEANFGMASSVVGLEKDECVRCVA